MVNTKVSELNPITNSNLTTSDLFMMARTETESFKMTIGELDKRFVGVNFTNYTQINNGQVVVSDSILLQTASGLARLAFSELDTRFAPPDINEYDIVLSSQLNSTDYVPVRQATGQKRVSIGQLDQRYLGAIPNISTNAKNNLVATNSDGTFLIRKNFRYPVIVDFLEVDPDAFFTPVGNVTVTNSTGDKMSGKQSALLTFSGTSEASVTSGALDLTSVSMRDKKISLNMDTYWNLSKSARFELETSSNGSTWNSKTVLNENQDITTSGTLKISFNANFSSDLYVRVKIFLNHANSSGTTTMLLDNIAIDIYPEDSANGGGSGGSASTARKTGGFLSMVDGTHFAISDGTGIQYDYYTDPENPVITEVEWSGITNALDQNLSSPITWVGIDKTGAVVQSTSEFTRSEKRDIISIGTNYHISNLIVDTSTISPIAQSPINQINDILTAIGTITDGNHFTFSDSGTGLQLKKTAGVSLVQGAGSTLKDPNTINRPEQDIIPFVLFVPDGSGGFIRTENVTEIDPNIYSDGQSTPNNDFTNVRIYYSAPANKAGVLVGPVAYDSMAQAQAGIIGEVFDLPPELTTVPLRTVLIVQEGTTDLSNPSDARFIKVGKFGQGIIGGTSTSTTTLQGAYNNSPNQPKIRLADVIGAMLIQDSISGLGIGVTRFGVQNSAGDAYFLNVTDQKVFVNQLGFEQAIGLNIGPTTNNNIQVTDGQESFMLRKDVRYPVIQDFKELEPSSFFSPSSGSGVVTSSTSPALSGARSASLDATADVEFVSSSFDLNLLSSIDREIAIDFDYYSPDDTFLYSARLESSTDNVSFSTVSTTAIDSNGTYKLRFLADKLVTRYYRLVFVASGVTVATSALVDNIKIDLYPSEKTDVQSVYDVSEQFKINLDQTKEGLTMVSPSGNPNIDYLKVLEDDELTEVFKVDNDGATARGYDIKDANGTANIGKTSENAIEVTDSQDTFVLRPDYNVLKVVDFRELDILTDVSTTANLTLSEVVNPYGHRCPQFTQSSADSNTDYMAIPVNFTTAQINRLSKMRNPKVAISAFRTGGSGRISCSIVSTVGTAYSKPEFILVNDVYSITEVSLKDVNANNLSLDFRFIPYVPDDATTFQVFGIAIYDGGKEEINIDRIFEWGFNDVENISEQVKGSLTTNSDNKYLQFNPSVNNEKITLEFDSGFRDFVGKPDSYNDFELAIKYNAPVGGYIWRVLDDADNELKSGVFDITTGSLPFQTDTQRSRIPINIGVGDLNGKIKVEIESLDGSTATDPLLIYGMYLDAKLYPLSNWTEINSVSLSGSDGRSITASTESVPFGTGVAGTTEKGWTFGADGSTPTTGNFYTKQSSGSVVELSGGLLSSTTFNALIVATLPDSSTETYQIASTYPDDGSQEFYWSDVGRLPLGTKIAIVFSSGVAVGTDATRHYINIIEHVNHQGVQVEDSITNADETWLTTNTSKQITHSRFGNASANITNDGIITSSGGTGLTVYDITSLGCTVAPTVSGLRVGQSGFASIQSLSATQIIIATQRHDNAFENLGVSLKISKNYPDAKNKQVTYADATDFKPSQVKTLVSSVASPGVVSQLTFNDLVIGESYEISAQMYMSVSASSLDISIANGSDELFYFRQSYGSANSLPSHGSRTFVATSTTVTVTLSGSGTLLHTSSRTWLAIRREPKGVFLEGAKHNYISDGIERPTPDYFNGKRIYEITYKGAIPASGNAVFNFGRAVQVLDVRGFYSAGGESGDLYPWPIPAGSTFGYCWYAKGTFNLIVQYNNVAAGSIFQNLTVKFVEL